MSKYKRLYTNINEEGFAYLRTFDEAEAYHWLDEFPNDSIEVTIVNVDNFEMWMGFAPDELEVS